MAEFLRDNTAGPFLELCDVDLAYGRQQVLNGFTLGVRPGEKVLLYGESGTGKSSVLRLFLGFALPSAGQVRVAGEELDPHHAWEIRKEIAYVPQDADVGEGAPQEILHWVTHLRANRGRERPGEEMRRYRELLRMDDELLGKQISDLSGGERQRVALLAALALNRQVYFLDEATASLDAGLKERVVNMFSEADPWTVIAVSHDPVWRDSGAFRVVPFASGRQADAGGQAAGKKGDAR